MQTPARSGQMELSIPDIVPSLNVQRRWHYAEYARSRRGWAWQVWSALNGKLPATPVAFARITLTRHAARTLDYDNWVGGAKLLLDVLRPVSQHNPNGLGLIEDDDASHVAVTYLQAKCSMREQRTVILIETRTA